MSPPAVSVVMPAYNAGAFLRCSSRSILDQTLNNLELIVVDDGSTDESATLLSELEAADTRVRILRQEHAGITAALNRGWAAARAPYIARMDADDVAHPSRLEQQVKALDDRPSLAVVGCRLRYVDESGRPLGTWKLPTGSHLVRWSLLFGTSLAHPTVVLRREAIGDKPPYNPSVRYAQDYDLWVRAAERGELDNLPVQLLDRRVHPSSISELRFQEQSLTAQSLISEACATLAGVTLSPGELQAIRAASDPANADSETVKRIPEVVARLRRSYLERVDLSRSERADVTRDAAFRVWTVARTIRAANTPLAARTALQAALMRVGAA